MQRLSISRVPPRDNVPRTVIYILYLWRYQYLLYTNGGTKYHQYTYVCLVIAENLDHTAHLLERHQVAMTLLLRLGRMFQILMVSHHVSVHLRS